MPSLCSRCRRATPPCAGDQRGRATRMPTNAGSAAGALLRTGSLKFLVRTKNARLRPCNDRASRSAPAGGCVRPVAWRVQAEISALAPCAIMAAPRCATSRASSVRPGHGPVSKTVPKQWLWVSCGRKTRKRRRKAASIFAWRAYKLSVSQAAGSGPRGHVARQRYRARRYPTPSSVSRMRGRFGSTSIFFRRLRTTMRR